MTGPKPIASLSLDLDNLWTYLKTRAEPGWETFPSYLERAVPILLDFLAARSLRITVFVVGRDAAIAANRPWLRRIAEAGHEIGNHSFDHEPWMHLRPDEEICAEIAQAEQAIVEATGRRPTGYRGPGHSLTLSALEALHARGYVYDASTLPTFTGPLIRAVYFRSRKFSPEEGRLRRAVGGGFREGLRPLRPYRWRFGTAELLEIPVTTLPGLRLPFHVTYLHLLAEYAPRLAKLYLAMALRLCRLTGTPPSLLLHPTDFLGADDVGEMAFFPGMNLPGERKRARLGEFLDCLQHNFEVVPLEDVARALATGDNLRVVPARFPRRVAIPRGNGGH